MTLERRVEERTAGLHRANATQSKEVGARQQAEEALRESNERFKDFAKLASDWFWETDENLRFTYFSEEFIPGIEHGLAVDPDIYLTPVGFGLAEAVGEPVERPPRRERFQVRFPELRFRVRRNQFLTGLAEDVV